MRILIAEDDPKLLKSLVHIFEMNHYAVDGVDNGNDAFDFASSDEYDGLVLDIMMPGMDGVTLLKKLRANGITTPALFLTAKTETYQKIEGLDAGADDYLPKPFSTGELLARVRAMLRRKDNFTPDLLTFEKLTLNRSTYELFSDIGNVNVYHARIHVGIPAPNVCDQLLGGHDNATVSHQHFHHLKFLAAKRLGTTTVHKLIGGTVECQLFKREQIGGEVVFSAKHRADTGKKLAR